MKYREYLETDHWKRLREVVIASANGKCQTCGCSENIEVHHIQYRSNWFKTQAEDLIALCAAYHSVAHFWFKWGPHDGSENKRSLIGMIKARHRPTANSTSPLKNPKSRAKRAIE